MKKTWVYALLSAIAITGMGFSSCSDNDAVAEPNPSYNSETGMLNVDFVFNVSTDNSASTRMTGEDTQASAGADFRGITNAYSSIRWEERALRFDRDQFQQNQFIRNNPHHKSVAFRPRKQGQCFAAYHRTQH